MPLVWRPFHGVTPFFTCEPHWSDDTYGRTLHLLGTAPIGRRELGGPHRSTSVGRCLGSSYP